MRALFILGLALSCGLVCGCGDDDESPAPATPLVTAALVVQPARGTIITDFAFDASGTTCNVDGLEYRWDWDADGVWDTGWSSTASETHRFMGPDTCRIVVEARVEDVSDRDTVMVALDIRHGELIASIAVQPAIETPQGVAFDGIDFWIADWGAPGTDSLYCIDATTGAGLDTLPAPSTWPGGMIWDGSALWVGDMLGGPKLFRVDPESGEVLESFPVVYSASNAGLAWTGDEFYWSSDRSEAEGDGDIHRYARDGAHLGAFDAPQGSEHPRGLAYDGENLWVSIEESDSLYVVGPLDGSRLWATRMGWSLGSFTFVGDYLWTCYRSEGQLQLGKYVP